jgi:hypothetical protein
MLAMLLAYDNEGVVVATLDYLVVRNAASDVVGLADFDAHEAAGGKLRDIWDVSNATGSGTWPEWLGSGAHDFTVELDKQKRIAALVHKTSGYRRERAAVEAAIAAVEPNAAGAKDIRHIVGGPDRPMALDKDGKTAPRLVGGTPAHLPVMGAG